MKLDPRYVSVSQPSTPQVLTWLRSSLQDCCAPWQPLEAPGSAQLGCSLLLLSADGPAFPLTQLPPMLPLDFSGASPPPPGSLP